MFLNQICARLGVKQVFPNTKLTNIFADYVGQEVFLKEPANLEEALNKSFCDKYIAAPETRDVIREMDDLAARHNLELAVTFPETYVMELNHKWVRAYVEQSEDDGKFYISDQFTFG